MSKQLDIAIDSVAPPETKFRSGPPSDVIASGDFDELLKEESGSKDDPNRREMLWEPREEQYLKKIILECDSQSRLHRRKGKLFKKLYMTFGVPSILIPIVLSGITEEIKHHPLLNSMLLMSAGIISGISGFFNFGRKYQEHFEFENKYSGLSQEIENELTKPKKNRVAVDVYLERVRLKYCNLNNHAPDVETPSHRPRKI